MKVSELFKIKYLLLCELSLLILFAVNGFVPFLIILSIILLGIILFLAFNSPIIAIHLLIFSILVDSLIPVKVSSSGPSLLVVEFFLATLVVLGIVKFLLALDRRSNIPNLILIWGPFLIWGIVIGLLVGVDKLRILTYWKNYFAGFFAFSLVYFAIKNKTHLKSILMGIIIWGLLLSLLEIKVLIELGGFTKGIVGLFLKKNLLTLGWGRSNYLSAFFVIIIPVTIGYLLYTKSSKLRFFITGTLVVMSFAMILTLSRGGILALLITLLILFSRVLRARTFIPIITILVVIVLVVLLNPLTAVLFERIATFDTSASYFSRITLYEEVWNSFLKYPITGVGLGNLGYYATFILNPDASPSAHNIVLGALGELGVIGSIMFFAILAFFIQNIYINFRNEKDESLRIFKWCCFSSFLGGIIHSFVEPTLEGLQFSIIFWTLAGVYFKLDMLRTSDVLQ